MQDILIMVKDWGAGSMRQRCPGVWGPTGLINCAESGDHRIQGWEHSGDSALSLPAIGTVYWFKIWMMWIPLALGRMWQYLSSITTQLTARSWTWAGSEEKWSWPSHLLVTCLIFSLHCGGKDSLESVEPPFLRDTSLLAAFSSYSLRRLTSLSVLLYYC